MAEGKALKTPPYLAMTLSLSKVLGYHVIVTYVPHKVNNLSFFFVG